jgi:hypothetical protein
MVKQVVNKFELDLLPQEFGWLTFNLLIWGYNVLAFYLGS